MEIATLGCELGKPGVVLVAAKRHLDNGTATMVHEKSRPRPRRP